MTKNIEILYEDDFILCINKPSNLIVHQSKFGGAIDANSLCQLLNKQLGYTAHPIHRLDRKTSGVLLFSKDKSIIPNLQKQLINGRAIKTYWALVRGHLHEKGIIDSPIKPEDKTEYKDALTHYRPLSKHEIDIPVQPYPKSRYTLMELHPKTGRTHQLRKHMNKISHPIIGDPKYGNRHHNHMFSEKLGITNLFLHARSIEFEHPIFGLNTKVSAPLFNYWEKCFEAFQWELPR